MVVGAHGGSAGAYCTRTHHGRPYQWWWLCISAFHQEPAEAVRPRPTNFRIRSYYFEVEEQQGSGCG